MGETMTTDTVRIYCDRQPEHERRGRTWIETFGPGTGQDNATPWRALPPQRGKGRTGDPRADKHHPHRPSSEAAVSASGEAMPDETLTVTAGGWQDPSLTRDGLTGETVDVLASVYDREALDEARMTYALRCKTCTLTVPVRGERLWPILDKLSGNGIGELSLDTLSGLVSRQ